MKTICLGKNTLKNTRIFANELDNGSKYAIYLIFSVIRVVAKVILTFITILICKSKSINQTVEVNEFTFEYYSICHNEYHWRFRYEY